MSLCNQLVWKYIGCVPVQIEMRIRRLKWLQELVTHKKNNKMVIAALVGTFEFEKKGRTGMQLLNFLLVT